MSPYFSMTKDRVPVELHAIITLDQSQALPQVKADDSSQTDDIQDQLDDKDKVKVVQSHSCDDVSPRNPVQRNIQSYVDEIQEECPPGIKVMTG